MDATYPHLHSQALPAGTVTFLFTDIEGSTRQWEHHPAEMRTALSAHHTFLRAAIAAHNGVVFETAGDSFVAVFEDAPSALRTALDAQVALTRAAWPEGIGQLKVRMALHTGLAEPRPDGYYAQHTLSRLSRILASGYGGQILVSGATQLLLQEQLPAEVELTGLGEHRLRDLIAPERIFQVSAPQAPWFLHHHFPPLKTLDSRPNNLPLQLTSLVGREQEVAAIIQLLASATARLVTLVGPGGTGKTRVALQVAAELTDHFEHGVCFVNLAPIRSSELVTQSIAVAVGVSEVADEPLAETLKRHLQDKRLLLVLDNFEQVAGAAPDVSQLVAAAPGLKLLVTSRVPLRIRGEKETPISPLSLPDLERFPPLEVLAQTESVRLFVDRATDIKPDFQLTHDNARAVAEICIRLDGLPLAIELAAARIRLLPPQAMLSRLQSRLKLLTGGATDVDARQQSLRGAIEWSYDLLTEGEQQLFRRLAVFVGGRTLEAIEAVCNADATLAVEVLDGVDSLVHHSLLRQEEGEGGEPRFTMLETIHEFAHERLVESVNGEKMRRLHALYFTALAEQVAPALNGPSAATHLGKLQREYGNLRAALAWALEGMEQGLVEQTDIGLRLAAALWRFWDYRGYWGEGSEWLDRVLRASTSESGNALARAHALSGAGQLAINQGNYSASRRYFQESVVACRAAGDHARSATALGSLGDIAYAEGDYASARPLLEEALAQSRRLGNQRNAATLLTNLGELMRAQGEYAAARELNETSLAELAALGDTGTTWAITGRCNLGHAVLREGDWGRALSLFMEALGMAETLKARHETAIALLGIASVAATRNASEQAVRLFAAADHLLGLLGATLWPADRLDYEYHLATARAQLDDDAFERARREGRAMTYEQAVALAREGLAGWQALDVSADGCACA